MVAAIKNWNFTKSVNRKSLIALGRKPQAIVHSFEVSRCTQPEHLNHTVLPCGPDCINPPAQADSA